MPASPIGKPTTVVLVGGGGIVSGKEIMMLALGRGLRDAGFKVEFITSLWGGEGEFASRLKCDGFKFYCVRLGFISISFKWKPLIWTLDQVRYWPSLVVGYLGALRAAAADIVIHTNWHHALLLLPFLNPKRDIYWSHEIVPNKWHYSQVFRAIADRTAFIVCVSHAAARSLTDLGIDPVKIAVIHNGIADIGSDHADTVNRPRLCIGIVGQIGAWKGHADLVGAFSLIARTNAGPILKIVGTCENEFATSLRKRIAELGLDDRVIWAGYVRDQALIYDDMDICVVPSRTEDPLPTTAIEAGLCGLPVVATTTGGLPEIVEHGVTGLLVPTGVPTQLAEAIEILIRDPKLRHTMGQNGRERMRRLYSKQRFVRDFRDRLTSDARLSTQKRFPAA